MSALGGRRAGERVGGFQSVAISSDASTLPSAGVFAVQADKKAPAETKTAKHLGLIAGGTGESPVSHLHL